TYSFRNSWARMLLMFRRLLVWGIAVTGAWCGPKNLPIAFEVNRGQADPEFGFVSRDQGYAVSLSASHMQWASGHSRVSGFLEGARVSAPSESEDRLPGVVNYLHGQNPAGWLLDIPTFGRVHYRDIYPGVDLVYYGKEGRLEYDFVLAPGAHPEQIRMRYAGARAIRLSRGGDLLLETAAGTIQQQRPVAYQEKNGRRRSVASRYILSGDTVRLEVARYDHSQPLVIDPPLTWATFSSFHSASSD